MLKKLQLLLLVTALCSSSEMIGCQKEQKDTRAKQTSTTQSSTKEKKKSRILLDVPIISQKPELENGCEVTSLAMLLQYAGIDTNKMTLAQQIKKDETILVRNEDGNIKTWGDPNDGFVGDITGKKEGFAVYPKPMLELMEQYLPGRSIDLSKQSFESLLKSIDQERPVIVWVTMRFKRPKAYTEWENNGNKIKATFDEHAVLLVGYDNKYCYVNNPANSKKNQKIKKDTFVKVWDTMGKMAISYT